MRALMNQHHMNSTIIGEAYPPSVEPISSLTPIMLHDLLLEKHHRGQVLIVRTFCEPVRDSAVQNAIEDVQGNVNRLFIYNLPPTTPVDKVLPKFALVAVKEPFLRVESDKYMAVQVDHPSDLILLKPDDFLVPLQWRNAPKTTMSGPQLKIEGNKAFKQGDWQRAKEIYSEALKKTDNSTELRLTLRRNRAQVHLNLGQYERASDDAISSIASGDTLSHLNKMLNVKSYFRAARAEYQLGHFSLAKEYLGQALGLDPTDETVIAELTRTEQRIAEQERGEFDFAAMENSATASHRKLDHASFIKKTKVAPAGKRGRGLFATETIKRGSLVLVEKAFSVLFDVNCSFLVNINADRAQFGTQADLMYETIDKIGRNPRHGSKVLDLVDGGNFKGKEVIQVDGAVAVDTFQVLAIAELNRFGCPSIRSGLDDEQNEEIESTGMWIQASYINHSCLHNTVRTFIGDMMILRASCDIEAGEEIVISYQSSAIPFPKRNKKFATWGFQCDCPLCRLERQLPAAVFICREQLVQEAKEFIAANPTSTILGQPVAKAKVSKAEVISKRLKETYDMYGAFPRLECISIDLWLVLAFGGRQWPTLDIATTSRLLQDLGYKLTVKGSEVSIDRKYGVVDSQVVHAAMWSRTAWIVAGKHQVAKTLRELAEEVYLIINGDTDNFEEKFGDLWIDGSPLNFPNLDK